MSRIPSIWCLIATSRWRRWLSIARLSNSCGSCKLTSIGRLLLIVGGLFRLRIVTFVADSGRRRERSPTLLLSTQSRVCSSSKIICLSRVLPFPSSSSRGVLGAIRVCSGGLTVVAWLGTVRMLLVVCVILRRVPRLLSHGS